MINTGLEIEDLMKDEYKPSKTCPLRGPSGVKTCPLRGPSGVKTCPLRGPSGVKTTERELIVSEIVATVLQAESAYGLDFRAELARRCASFTAPEISDADLERMRAMREEFESRWRNLEDGSTLEVVL